MVYSWTTFGPPPAVALGHNRLNDPGAVFSIHHLCQLAGSAFFLCAIAHTIEKRAIHFRFFDQVVGIPPCTMPFSRAARSLLILSPMGDKFCGQSSLRAKRDHGARLRLQLQPLLTQTGFARAAASAATIVAISRGSLVGYHGSHNEAARHLTISAARLTEIPHSDHACA